MARLLYCPLFEREGEERKRGRKRIEKMQKKEPGGWGGGRSKGTMTRRERDGEGVREEKTSQIPANHKEDRGP